ncbi:MACPF domain-containing protein NSL1 [Iris pallida]|uniref:MACPF domain-containing protein NSL1 n=1 Tax=Iris pallida TaxID=29817 RepID=A0AAX6H4N2_IRIPA|nr:MACPF domain-containing protein NSL1 [Iris pallida]
MRPADPMSPEAAAALAVSAVGRGYDLSSDLRLAGCRPGTSEPRLIELDGAQVHDLELPGGVTVRDVPKSIKCDKGERTRFCSDVLPFLQMSEQFNQDIGLSGKIPSGLFNAMFDFRGWWQKDMSSTKSLCFDCWSISLYSIELARSHIVLTDEVKRDVPSSWDPAALAEFIEKYGTHIVTGVKMGGKDVVSIKQQQDSVLPQSVVQNLLKILADDRFSEGFNGNFTPGTDELSTKVKNIKLTNQGYNMPVVKSTGSSIVTHLKDDLISIYVRRGGINTNQSHNQWLSTISQAPNVISMSFVPITALLTGVPGIGFLTHAVNLYLRYKPPIEELHQFLAFQLPREWAPAFGEFPVGPRRRKHSFPSLQFSLLGPRLFVNTVQVDSENRPVTGIRLYLGGKRNDCLAIHLQHLSTRPNFFQVAEDSTYAVAEDDSQNEREYYEPIKWALLSHICTAPVQYSGASIEESASVVTKAWLEVRVVGMRKVLFLRLGFSNLVSMRIRRSEWVGSTTVNHKSGSISALISSRFSTSMIPEPKPKVEVNSAVFPGGPPLPTKMPKLSRFVDTSEMMRGPDDLPGYWVVTGAKLCVESGKISLKVKYSLLVSVPDDDF